MPGDFDLERISDLEELLSEDERSEGEQEEHSDEVGTTECSPKNTIEREQFDFVFESFDETLDHTGETHGSSDDDDGDSHMIDSSMRILTDRVRFPERTQPEIDDDLSFDHDIIDEDEFEETQLSSMDDDLSESDNDRLDEFLSDHISSDDLSNQDDSSMVTNKTSYMKNDNDKNNDDHNTEITNDHHPWPNRMQMYAMMMNDETTEEEKQANLDESWDFLSPYSKRTLVIYQLPTHFNEQKIRDHFFYDLSLDLHPLDIIIHKSIATMIATTTAASKRCLAHLVFKSPSIADRVFAVLSEKLSHPSNKSMEVRKVPDLIDACIDGHLRMESECKDRSVRVIFTNLHWLVKERSLMHFIRMCLQKWFLDKAKKSMGEWSENMPMRLFLDYDSGGHRAFADCASPKIATVLVHACHLRLLNDRMVYVDWQMTDRMVNKMMRKQKELQRKKQTNTLVICGLTLDTNEQDIYDCVRKVLEKKNQQKKELKEWSSSSSIVEKIELRMSHSRRMSRINESTKKKKPMSMNGNTDDDEMDGLISTLNNSEKRRSELRILGMESPGVCFVTLSDFDTVSMVCKHLQFRRLKNGSIFHTMLSDPVIKESLMQSNVDEKLKLKDHSHWLCLMNVPWNVNERHMRLLVRSVMMNDERSDIIVPTEIVIGEDSHGYSTHQVFLKFETKEQTSQVYRNLLKQEFNEGSTLFMGRNINVSVYLNTKKSDPNPEMRSHFPNVGSIVQSFVTSSVFSCVNSWSSFSDDSSNVSDTRLRLQRQALFGFQASRRFGTDVFRNRRRRKMIQDRKKLNNNNENNGDLNIKDNADIIDHYRVSALNLSRDRRKIERLAAQNMIDTRILAKMKNGETREHAMPMNRRQLRKKKRMKHKSIGVWTKFNMRKSVWDKLKDARDWNTGQRVLPKYLAAKQTVRVKNYWSDSRKFQRRRSRNRHFIQQDRSHLRSHSKRVR